MTTHGWALRAAMVERYGAVTVARYESVKYNRRIGELMRESPVVYEVRLPNSTLWHPCYRLGRMLITAGGSIAFRWQVAELRRKKAVQSQ